MSESKTFSEREKLIELLQNVPTDFEGNRNVGTIADYLLANGVITLPCEIGKTVWVIDGERVLEMVCVGFLKTHKRLQISISRGGNFFVKRCYGEWNLNVFSTEEKAKKALAERTDRNE